MVTRETRYQSKRPCVNSLRFSRRNSQTYNKLPEVARVIAGRVIAETRKQHLNFEKERLRKAYQRQIAEINKHIEAVDRFLLKGDRFDDGKPKTYKE